MINRVSNLINPDQEKQRKKQDKEISRYSLVGRGGWLTYCKIMIAVLLAVWNANFFINTINGLMGFFTAFEAVNLEMMALYCVHNYTRSINDHKKWLGRFAIILGTFSLTHCVFAVIHYTKYSQQNRFIEFYSHVIALPLIIVLLYWSIAKLSMAHYSAVITDNLASTKIQSLTNRANVLMQQNQLLDAQELALLRAALFESETQMKIDLIPIVRRRIGAQDQLERMVKDIDNDETRNEIKLNLAELDGTQINITPTPPKNVSAKVSPAQPAYTNGGNGSSNGRPTPRW